MELGKGIAANVAPLTRQQSPCRLPHQPEAVRMCLYKSQVGNETRDTSNWDGVGTYPDMESTERTPPFPNMESIDQFITFFPSTATSRNPLPNMYFSPTFTMFSFQIQVYYHFNLFLFDNRPDLRVKKKISYSS